MSSTEVDTTPNGHTGAPGPAEKSKSQSNFKRKEKPRRGYFGWSLALIVRLFIWYTVLTPFFRCPSDLSGLDDSSPRVCKPYLIARSYVDPHVDRYYQAYAAPYVERARPYTEPFNQHVYTPASSIAKYGYESYGAPAFARVSEYGQQKWEAVAVPQLKSLQSTAYTVYEAKVDPYVQQVINVVTPYTNTVSTRAMDIHNGYILPFYLRSQPILTRAYSSSHDVITETIIPFTHQGWSSLTVFVKGNLLPSITGLYSQNVEPQLVRIGERLASYREGKKLRTVVDEYEGSTEALITESATSVTGSAADAKTAAAMSTPRSAETQPPLTPEQEVEIAKEQIASDLLLWKRKFAAAADKGVEDLGDRVESIVNSQLENGAKTDGETLIEALETVQDHEVRKIKQQINDLVERLPGYAAPAEEEKANAELFQFIRQAGIEIRDRAHALREWYNGFEKELLRRVTAAADSTLEVLDSVRDLGLQEIGMRWAYLDHVTYKDWTKYHALRKQFDEWRDEVYAAGLNHAKVEEARTIAGDILSRGMGIAEDAAKELSRLKEVGKWKIQAREVSEDFETRTEPPPPLAGPEEDKVEENVSDSATESISTAASSVFEETEPIVDKITTVHIELADATPEASDAQKADEFGGSSESDSSPEESDGQEADIPKNTDSVQGSTVWGGVAAQVVANQVPILEDEEDESQIASALESISSVASSRLQAGLHEASAQLSNLKASIAPTPTSNQNPIFLDAQRRYYEAIGLAHDQYSAFVTSASKVIYAKPSPTTTPAVLDPQNLLEEAISQFHQVSSLASSSLAAVVASASSLADKSGDSTRGIIDDALLKYSNAMVAASSSLSIASESASSALYGTPTGALESIATQASERWESMISQASEQIYGTPTPLIQQFYDQQASRFEALESFVSELVVGKEPSFTESVMSRLRSAYETPYPTAAFSSASSYANEAYSSASSFVATHATLAPALEDILNAANKQLDAAVEGASVYVYGTSKGTYEQATSAVAEAYSAASSHVHEAIHGTQPGYIEAARSQVDVAFSSAQTAISTAIYGTPTGPAESAMSAASNAYASVTSAVQDNVAAAGSMVDDAYSQIQSKASSAWHPEQQQGALEIATSRLALAVESAQARLSDLASKVGDGASKLHSEAGSVVESYESAISSAASKIKDEL